MGDDDDKVDYLDVDDTIPGQNYACLSFVSPDELIEKKEGCTINLIFKRKGEGYFRKLENDFSLQEFKRSNSVISLGGGAFLNKLIRTSSQKITVSFWLDVGIEELIKRLKKTNKRPLLYKKNLSEEIKKIYAERKKTYNEADFRIKCNFLKLNEIVDKILKLYEKSGNKI